MRVEDQWGGKNWHSESGRSDYLLSSVGWFFLVISQAVMARWQLMASMVP